jgi:hypothetical protein
MRGRAKTSILKTKDAQTTAPDPTPEQEGTCCFKLRLFEGHPEARSGCIDIDFCDQTLVGMTNMH